MKFAEDGDEIVVRLNEGAGTPVEHYALRLGAGVAEARELFASEEEKGPATVKDGCLVTDFTPYQIRTFALRLQPAAQVGHAAKATPLTLPMNVQLITKQGEQGEPAPCLFLRSGSAIRSRRPVFLLPLQRTARTPCALLVRP